MSEPMAMTSSVPDDDRSLVQRIGQGDRHAFAVLYDRHVGWLTVRLERRCADRDLIDATIQDTFVSVARLATGHREIGDVGAWIWAIGIRHLVHRCRTRRTAKHAMAEVISHEVPLALGPRELGRVYATLPPESQAAVAITAIDGLSAAEAATLIGVSTGTVKQRLRTAREQLLEAEGLKPPAEHVETALGRAAQRPRFLAGADAATGPGPDLRRVASNFAAIEAELDSPAPPMFARILRRLGVDDVSIPLATSTPALCRPWVLASVISVVLALGAAAASNASGAEGIVAFLTVAPMVPLLGIALALGPGVDPTHEITIAAPVSGFRLASIRVMTVIGTSSLALVLASSLAPTGGWYRVGWLLPAVAVSMMTAAGSTRFDPRLVAGGVTVGWLTTAIVSIRQVGAAATFGLAAQLIAFAIAALGLVLFAHHRRRLDVIAVPR